MVCYVWKRLADISVEKIGGIFIPFFLIIMDWIFAAAWEYTYPSRSKNSRPCYSFELNKSFNYSNIQCFIILYMIRNVTICQKYTKCYDTSDHGCAKISQIFRGVVLSSIVIEPVQLKNKAFETINWLEGALQFIYFYHINNINASIIRFK